MFRRTFLAAGTATAILVAPAFAASYTIDPTHSFVAFETGHLGFSRLPGRFNKLSGTLNYDPAGTPADQSVKVVIDTASLDTNHAERDKHLRSADFFDVGKFGRATFESTAFEGGPEGGTVKGNLSFMGLTKEIAFPIKLIGAGKDPWGSERVGFEGEYTLTRADWGMDYDLGPPARDVKVRLLIEAIKDK